MPFEREVLSVVIVNIETKEILAQTQRKMIMNELIVNSLGKINSLLKKLQIGKILSIVIVGLLILTTNVDPGLSKQAATDKIDKMLQQDNDPNRPKTTGEWNQQARETKGKPGERLKRIGEQSADAIKEFGEMYPEVAENSVKELKK